MEQELVTLTQPTADDIPLLAGGNLRIAHITNAAHDIHYSVRTIRNPNDNLQGTNILHRPLTPTHSTLPRSFTFGNEENTVHDTEATPTFLPGRERTGDKSPDTLSESSSRDKRISSRDDTLLYGNKNTTDLAIDVLPSGLNDRREKYHFTARGKFRKYRHE